MFLYFPFFHYNFRFFRYFSSLIALGTLNSLFLDICLICWTNLFRKITETAETFVPRTNFKKKKRTECVRDLISCVQHVSSGLIRDNPGNDSGRMVTDHKSGVRAVKRAEVTTATEGQSRGPYICRHKTCLSRFMKRASDMRIICSWWQRHTIENLSLMVAGSKLHCFRCSVMAELQRPERPSSSHFGTCSRDLTASDLDVLPI